MKKTITLVLLIIITITLSSCVFTDLVISKNEKEKIVSEKYGEVEYIFEEIIVYKNLSSVFSDVEGIDYIEKNIGSIRSNDIIPLEDFYVRLDIVKHNSKYKILVYNNFIKRSANVTKMFVLTDYLLPVKIEDVIALLDVYNKEAELSKFNVLFARKDYKTENPPAFENEISSAYYQKISENEIFMSFYDNDSGNTIVGSNYKVIFGNVIEKVIYYPQKLMYDDFTNDNYNTLNDKKVEFSLDKGNTYQEINNKLEEFDLWKEQINSEVSNYVFFYAFTYEEFLIKLNEANNPNIYTYNYLSEEEFDSLKEQYDEDYFLDNILIFYYKFEANISENYVYSITKKGNTLTVNINRFEGMYRALSSWMEVITIKKSDLEQITKVDLIVRTIAEKATIVTANISKEHLRDFYLNDLTMDDFKDLNNLKGLTLFRWSLNVDVIINKDIDDNDLERLINYLEASESVLSVGYKGKDFIRVQLKYSFYDEVVNKTLLIDDLLKDQVLIDELALSISILNFMPFGYLSFVLEETGKEFAKQMIEDLKSLNYKFIEDEGFYFE